MAQQNILPFASDDRFADLTPGHLTQEEADSVVALALEVLAARHQPGDMLDSPVRTKQYLQLLLSERQRESFGIVFLDNRHRILATEELFHGTVDGASVHPRIVVQRALELNSSAMVLFHNHPSGDPEPSRADETITARIREALAFIDVRVLDHIIVGTEGTHSFAEAGLL